MMNEEFLYDVFLSHSTKDKPVVRDTAERLRKDGLRVWFDVSEIHPGDEKTLLKAAKVEEALELSRVLVLCMSVNASSSEWSQLEAGTFRFRDPLNKQRRLVLLRLDEAPIKSSLAQFLCIDWVPASRVREFKKLVAACLPPASRVNPIEVTAKFKSRAARRFASSSIFDYSFSSKGIRALTAGDHPSVQLWDMATGDCTCVFSGHEKTARSVAFNASESHALSCSDDGTIRLWDVKSGNSLRVFKGHDKGVSSVSWSPDGLRALTGGADFTIRLWDVKTGICLRVLKGHKNGVNQVKWSGDGLRALSASDDSTVRIWDLESGECLQLLEGHSAPVTAIDWGTDQLKVVSGSNDTTVRLWDTVSGRCIRVFEGHTDDVYSVALHANQRHALSGSRDMTSRLWDVETGLCSGLLDGHTDAVVHVSWSDDQRTAFSGDRSGGVRKLSLESLASGRKAASMGQVQYSNAKVLLVGDTSAGKTGLAHRLATFKWKPSDESTVGVWATQWKLVGGHIEQGVDREIWLWDFGGQADQRLIHQLYMDRSAVILLLFNADQEDVLTGLRDWLTALRRCVKVKIPHFLVAGRIDSGFKASKGKVQSFAKQEGLAYHETSAKDGTGCDELREALSLGIPWGQMEKRTSPRIFKLIKDEVLKLRDEGQVLHTFKELRELLWRRLPDEPRFADETLQTVIGLLDGPGVVKELDYGTYILLAPEWINAYAQAVIRTLRSADNDLGVLPLRSIAEGRLIYQSIGRDGAPVEMKRLPPAEERVVLGEMERQLEQRGLCLRQGEKLVFPSHCGRDRPSVQEHPSVFVSYAVKGFLDDIYATLVVKLADCQSFTLKELWRDAADFRTLVGLHQMGIKLTRATASDGEISVYFGKGVTQQEQVIFANYIHAHLEGTCENAQRLRHYVCPKCHSPKGNAEVLMKKLLREKQSADTECDGCGERFPLWDALEKKFASDEVRRQVEELQADDLLKLTGRRKGKLLVLDVGARITSANQKWMEVPGDEDDGIDMLVEFTDEDGNGIGKGLCLQLKAGNSHLTKRKDGTEIFTIKKQRWVKTWTNQPHPVMLVIGTFPDEDERATRMDKLEFADIRWMEITSVLRRESGNGTKPVKQIEFTGERLDMSSVQKWREILCG